MKITLTLTLHLNKKVLLTNNLLIIDIVEDMKSPKEDYEIRKSVVSDPGTGEDLLNFLSFYNLVI